MKNKRVVRFVRNTELCCLEKMDTLALASRQLGQLHTGREQEDAAFCFAETNKTFSVNLVAALVLLWTVPD